MSDHTIHASVGVPFTLTVDESAATGYVWHLVPEQSPEIQLLDEGLVRDDSSDLLTEDRARLMIGGGGQRTLTFKATKSGTHCLRLRLGRPWLGKADDTAQVRDWQVHAEGCSVS